MVGRKDNLNKRTVITGIGPITSIGVNVDDFWESILSNKTNISKEQYALNNNIIEEFHIHKVKNFNLNSYDISEEALNSIRDWRKDEIDPDLAYLIAAIQVVLKDSGLEYDFEKNDIGLIVGHGNPGLEQFWDKAFTKTYEIFNKSGEKLTQEQYFQVFFDEFVRSSYDLQTYMYIFHLAKLFNLHGAHLIINNACSSGLSTLDLANDAIQSGKTKTVLVAASGYTHVYKFLWFKQYGYPYAEDGLIRPFSINANGMVAGEGGVALLIEELEHAKKRGAKIYGEYISGGFKSESWKVTLPDVSGTYYQDSILKALDKANIQKEEIDLINPHGTGMSVIDKYEMKTLNKIFSCPLISAFKPYIGHCIGASALMETAILLLAIKNNIIPATLNCDQIDPKFKMDVVRKNTKKELNYVLKTCCAIAGFDAAIILRKFIDE